MSVPPSSGRRVLTAALLMAFAVPAGAPAQEQKKAAAERERAEAVLARAVAAQQQRAVSDAQFDQWVFQQDRNAPGARKRLESFLTLQVEEIDRACTLTEPQKQKLQLTGRGDIVRFFTRYEELKQKVLQVNPDQDKFFQEMWQDIQPLQLVLQTGLFHEDSLLHKALRHTLTGEQFARYEAAVRDRREFRHRANVELAVTVLEQGMPLRDAQRRELIALLVKETKPARKSGGFYEYYVTMYQLGRLPEGKLKPVLDAAQWKTMGRLVEQYRGIEPFLRQNGMLPDEDGEAGRIEVRPPAPAALKK
jgi:hypothetical protein